MSTRKKNTTLVIILVAVISCVAQGAEPVYFADPNLKACVEEQLGIIDPTPMDMFRLNELSCISQGITDLTGIENAPYLRSLYLPDNEIGDISALSGLSSVEKLYLQNNFISDISGLVNMMNLTWLELQNNYLDAAAYSEYLPLIKENNPTAKIIYDNSRY